MEMQNNDYIYGDNSTMDNFDFQTFYNPPIEDNYSKISASQFISSNERNSRCILYQEQEQFKNNYCYPDQSSYYYSQSSNLCNQWIDNTTFENANQDYIFENANQNYIFENKDFYHYKMPKTTSPLLIDSPNIEIVRENYQNHSYPINQAIQSNFQQNTSLSSNELSLASTLSPPIESNMKLKTVPSHPGMLYLMPTLLRASKKEKKNDTPKISKGRISKKPSMHVNSSCITCGTTETTLWRRDINGFPECNPCNLYYRTHQTKRPPRLFKNGKILKRNGKNKQLKNSFGSSPHNARAFDI